MSKIKLILAAMLTLGLVGTISAQEAQESSAQEETKEWHPKFSVEGHLDTGWYREQQGETGLFGEGSENHFTAGDSKVTLSADLGRVRANIRARLKHLDIYDENGARSDIEIEEVIDQANLEIRLSENGDFAVVIGKISVPAGLSAEEGYLFDQNSMRKYNLMAGHLGMKFDLKGDALFAAQRLVDRVEITGFENQDGDFKFGSDVDGSKTGIGGSIRVTKSLTDITTAQITQLVMKDRDLDAKAYRTSVAVVNEGSFLNGRNVKQWTEGIVSRNYDPITNQVSASEDEANDTYGLTTGADVEVLDNVFLTMEGTYLKDEAKGASASIRYEHESGMSAGLEAKATKQVGDYSPYEEEQYDLRIGARVRADIGKFSDFLSRQ